MIKIKIIKTLMENNVNFKYFEEYEESLKTLQKEDKFFESIKLVEDIGIIN